MTKVDKSRPRWEETFYNQLAAAGIEQPWTEHRFAPPRKFRFDYVWLQHRVALEVEGGAFVQGRHTRGVGYVRDMEKYNLATVMGWRVLRFTPDQVQQGEPIASLASLLGDGKPHRFEME